MIWFWQITRRVLLGNASKPPCLFFYCCWVLTLRRGCWYPETRQEMLNKSSFLSPRGICVWFVSLTATKLHPDLRIFNLKVSRSSRAGWEMCSEGWCRVPSLSVLLCLPPHVSSSSQPPSLPLQALFLLMLLRFSFFFWRTQRSLLPRNSSDVCVWAWHAQTLSTCWMNIKNMENIFTQF